MRRYVTPLGVIATALIIAVSLGIVLRHEIKVTPWGYWDSDRWAGTLTACELLYQPSEHNRRVVDLIYPPYASAKIPRHIDKESAEVHCRRAAHGPN